jgi:hypothetical protein
MAVQAETYIEISNKPDDIIQFYTTKTTEIRPNKQPKRGRKQRNSDIVVQKQPQTQTTTTNDKSTDAKQIAKLNKIIKTKTAKIERLINEKNDIVNEKNKIIQEKDEIINKLLQQIANGLGATQSVESVETTQFKIANTPKYSFQQCLEHLTVNNDDYDYVVENGYVKGYCDIAVKVLNQNDKLVVSHKKEIYVYLNATDKWVAFTEEHSKQLHNQIKSKLIVLAANRPNSGKSYELRNRKIIYGTNGKYIDIYLKIKQTLTHHSQVNTETLLSNLT